MLMTILVAALALVLSACGTVGELGGSTNPPTPVADQQSAAAFLPTNYQGYRITNADSITDAITAVAGDGADIFGNAAISATINQMDNFIQCYQDVGAVAANIYTETNLSTSIGSGQLPGAGAVAVVNQDRIRENLLSCALQRGETRDFSSQNAGVCQGNGSFARGGDNFTYIFFSTSQTFCDQTQQHFRQYGS